MKTWEGVAHRGAQLLVSDPLRNAACSLRPLPFRWHFGLLQKMPSGGSKVTLQEQLPKAFFF